MASRKVPVPLSLRLVTTVPITMMDGPEPVERQTKVVGHYETRE